MNLSPYNRQRESTRQPPSSGGAVLVLLLVVGLVFGYWFATVSNAPDPVTPIPDDTVIVEPDDGKEVIDPTDDEDKVAIDDTYLIRVYETEADQTPVWFMKFVGNDFFWFDWLDSKGMRYFSFDPSSNPEQSASFLAAAAKKDIEPPFLLHCKRGGEVLWARPITEDLTIEKVKSLILAKVKDG